MSFILILYSLNSKETGLLKGHMDPTKNWDCQKCTQCRKNKIKFLTLKFWNNKYLTVSIRLAREIKNNFSRLLSPLIDNLSQVCLVSIKIQFKMTWFLHKATQDILNYINSFLDQQNPWVSTESLNTWSI